MNKNLEALIRESEEIHSDYMVEQWQTKVEQYLHGIGELRTLESFRRVKGGNGSNEVSAQTGILIALTEIRGKSFQPDLKSNESKIRKIEIPEKITWRWISDHVPLKIWMVLAVMMVAVFSAGLKLGEYEIIKKIWDTITK